MTPTRTERLILRPWRDSDGDSFAALCADPEVMAHLLGVKSREEIAASVDRIREHFDREGFGLWAVEVPGEADFIGFVGLVRVPYQAHFTPAVEAAWRLARAHWGKGYATEAAAAAAAVEFGFARLNLDEVVAMTVPANARSRRVMEKLGMTRAAADDFDHPRVPDGHPLKRHLLYRLRREDWSRSRIQGRRNHEDH